jgi:hypothetical protein
MRAAVDLAIRELVEGTKKVRSTIRRYEIIIPLIRAKPIPRPLSNQPINSLLKR